MIETKVFLLLLRDPFVWPQMPKMLLVHTPSPYTALATNTPRTITRTAIPWKKIHPRKRGGEFIILDIIHIYKATFIFVMIEIWKSTIVAEMKFPNLIWKYSLQFTVCGKWWNKANQKLVLKCMNYEVKLNSLWKHACGHLVFLVMKYRKNTNMKYAR